MKSILKRTVPLGALYLVAILLGVALGHFWEAFVCAGLYFFGITGIFWLDRRIARKPKPVPGPFRNVDELLLVKIGTNWGIVSKDFATQNQLDPHVH